MLLLLSDLRFGRGVNQNTQMTGKDFRAVLNNNFLKDTFEE